MDDEAIGRKVRELRTKLGLRGVDLAKKAGLSQAQVSRLENGLQPFRSATLIKLARVLEVAPLYLAVAGKGDALVRTAEELAEYGLTPSRKLRKAMTDADFLKFLEECSRTAGLHKKNLVAMKKALKRAMRKR